MTHNVFVYGTLLRGEPNHHHLAHARFVGATATLFGFTLFNRGPYPVLSYTGVGTGTSVKGEVYNVTEETLARLDRLEGHPNHYQRTEITLNTGVKAFTYLQAPEACRGMPVIPEGDWRVASPHTPKPAPKNVIKATPERVKPLTVREFKALVAAIPEGHDDKIVVSQAEDSRGRASTTLQIVVQPYNNVFEWSALFGEDKLFYVGGKDEVRS